MEKENKVIYNPNEIYGTNSQSKYSVSEVKEMCDEVRKILNKGEMNMENKWKNEGLVMLIKSKKELECYCRTRRVINELIPNIDNLFVSIDELKQEAKTGVSVPDDFTFKNIITLVKDFNKSIDEHQDDRWDVDFITISCDNELTQLIETHNIHGHNIDSYDYAILMLNENDSREIPMVVLKSRCIIDYYTELREKPALPFDGIDDTLIGLLVRIPTTMYSVYQDDILDKDLTYMVKSLSSKLKNLEVVRFPELKDKYPDSDNYELINVINEIIEDIEFDVINLSTSLFRLPSSGVNESINKVIKNYNAKFPMYHLIGILYLVKHDGRYFISSTDMNCQKVLMDNLEHHDLPMLLSFYCTNFEEVYSVNRSMISEMIEKTFNEFNVIYCKDINEILCNEIYSDDMVYISNKIPQKINKTGYIISRVFTNLKPNPENELGGFIPKASPSVNLESITYAQYIVLLYRHELDIYYGFIKSRELD